ncbi:MAG: TIGR01777 family protein [Flavobacteriales bacterium]|nr:TIGR01777 family protein [Flavobacteriales bacterium]
MKETILITGYNGSLSKRLSNEINKDIYNIKYLTTQKKYCSKNVFYWNTNNNYIDESAIIDTHHIIHLAGYNISNRWTKSNKEKMYESRVYTCKLLYESCLRLNVKPKTFISASAMGYYGFHQSGIKKETDSPQKDWMSTLCLDWEKMANQFNILNTRVCKLRLALILEKDSEIIQKTKLGFHFGMGAVFGDGKQPFPWIHIDDVVNFIIFTLRNQTIKGTYNVASTEKTSFYQFIKAFKKVRYNNSILIFIPRFIIKWILREKTKLIFNDFYLSVEKMQKTKFKLKYDTIEKAIDKEINLIA